MGVTAWPTPLHTPLGTFKPIPSQQQAHISAVMCKHLKQVRWFTPLTINYPHRDEALATQRHTPQNKGQAHLPSRPATQAGACVLGWPPQHHQCAPAVSSAHLKKQDTQQKSPFIINRFISPPTPKQRVSLRVINFPVPWAVNRAHRGDREPPLWPARPGRPAQHTSGCC